MSPTVPAAPVATSYLPVVLPPTARLVGRVRSVAKFDPSRP
ncbi:MAG: hypothetical protein U0804_13800 [Gemmataceae bacterium]